MRPKILHVSQATGGVETCIVLLLRHLDQRRFDVHLACPPKTGLASQAMAMGFTVFEVPMVRRADPYSDSLALMRLVRLMRRERYDIIHAHSAKGGFLGRLAARVVRGPPTIYAPQAFSYLSQRGVARRFFLKLERLAVPWTHVLHAASESEKTRAIGEVGFRADRVVVIPNSIDLDEGVSVRGGPPPDQATVLTMGRLAYQKNPEMFVRVARRILDRRPDTRFLMVGAGFASPLERSIRALVSASGLSEHLQIVPWVEKTEALRLMAECSVFVLTSRFEGMPNTLLEAMMLSKPAVVTDVDGSRDAMRDGESGFVVAPDDDEAMADRVTRLLDELDLAQRLGDGGRHRALDLYDIRKNARVVEALYERMLNG